MTTGTVGMRCASAQNADKRRSWDPHSCNRWNVGTSIDHHRCFKVWIKNTGSERDTDTVFSKHKYLKNPIITPKDKVVAAAQILTQTIKGNLTGESEEMEALEEVAEIFEMIANRKSRK